MLIPACALSFTSCVRSSTVRERYLQARDATVRGQQGNQTVAFFPELDRQQGRAQSAIVTVDQPLTELPR